MKRIPHRVQRGEGDSEGVINPVVAWMIGCEQDGFRGFLGRNETQRANRFTQAT